VNNLNDNAPAIADAVVSLDENVAAGTAVTNVDDSFTDSDLDRDGDTISYSITDGNGDGIFAIDAATGAISIATGKSLDYETASQHVLTVTASDGSLSDTAQVTVNVNNLNAAPIAIDDINTVVELPANALYYSDNSGNIGILDPTTGTRTLIGNAGQTFTDIALDSSGNLFGATFGSLYSIDPTTGSATLIGSIGAGPINALVTSPDGRLFAANTSGGVYELSTATGTATSVGSFDHGSSGDLLFTDNSLYLSTSNGTIEKLDLASGTVTTVMTGLPSTLYNLAQTDVGTIYGSTSDGNLYLIDLVAGTATVTGVVSAGAEMWGFAAAPVDSSQVTISGDVTPGTPGQDYDPDGTAVTVIGVAAGTPATAPNSGVASVINGTYGTLTLDAGGSYTYTLDNTRAAVQDLDTGEVADEVFTYTITDADGATDTATLTIKVSGAGEVALLIASASANVSEEGLSGANADSAGTTDTTNNTSASGTLNISNANSDILSFSLTAPATALSSGGQPVQWSGSGTSQLTGTVNGVTALLISIDNVGNYNVDLLAPLDHAGSGEDLKSFGVTITVNDGSSTSSSILTVNIEDDSPLLATPMQAVLLDGIGASAIGDLHLSLGADQSGSSIQLSGLSVDGSGNILATTLSKAGVVISTSSYLTYQGAKLHYVTELDGSLKAVSSEGVDVFKVTASPVSGQYQITNYVSLDSSSSTFNSFKLSGGNSGVYDLGTGSNFTLLATATANGTADTVNTSNNSFGVGDGQAIDTGDVLTFTFSDKTTGAVTNMSAIALTTDKLDSNEQLTWTAYDSANQIVGSGTLNGVNGGKTSLTIDASKLNVGEYEFSSVNFGAASGTSYKLAITSITGQTATYDQQISLNVTAQDGDSDSSASQPLLITFDSDNSVQAGASGTALGGDSGNNNLIGGEGDDILLGASGNDTLTGGAGADTFVWRAGDTGNDVVKDFNKGEDVIDLSDLLSDVAEDNLVSFLRVDTATSTLQINTSGLLDGSGGNADITIKLENAGGFALSASDTINTLIAGGDLKVSHD
ncbi:beta strand repeat-containing protein, partial [Pseudomonas borbori]